MKLEIITPDQTIYSGDQVHLVQLPGTSGSFEVMEHHAPLITILKKGRVKVVEKQAEGNKASMAEKFFEINGGVIEVLNNRVLVLAE